MSITSQEFDSYLTVSDIVPEVWEDARIIITEQMKKIADAVNVRQIGWYLDQELLSGGQFIPGVTSANNQQFRTILRKVIDCSPLVPGVNNFAHGINFDANFTLMELYAAATNPVAFTAEPIPNGADTVSMNATNIVITVAANWTRAFAVVNYIQEL